MDNSGRDFETGLSQQQLQAAKLLADGWSIPKAAETCKLPSTQPPADTCDTDEGDDT